MSNPLKELDISIACLLDEPTEVTVEDLQHIQKQVDLLVIEEEKKKNQIDITWCVDDIRYLGYECTDEKGMEVLDEVLRRHDAELGICWDTLDWYCKEHGLKRKEVGHDS